MLFSTSYFGSIPYFQAIAQYNIIKLDGFEQYKKQSWRNRTQILESNGPMYLSVPVKRPSGSKTLVKDVFISNETNWQKDHWKAIESSYKHAPYFFYYGNQVKELIFNKEKNLMQFNLEIIKRLLDWFDLDINIAYSKKYSPPKNERDYRITLNKKHFSNQQKPYIQVFSDKYPFFPNLSILDLIMNLGPLGRNYIFPGQNTQV